jgi:hypothetical protein
MEDENEKKILGVLGMQILMDALILVVTFSLSSGQMIYKVW